MVQRPGSLREGGTEGWLPIGQSGGEGQKPESSLGTGGWGAKAWIPMGVGGGAEGKEAGFLQGRVEGQRSGSPWGDEG